MHDVNMHVQYDVNQCDDKLVGDEELSMRSVFPLLCSVGRKPPKCKLML